MSNLLTRCCCSQGWGPFLFHGAKHPFMQATRARKFSKYLLYCMLSLSIFWLAAAVIRAEVPVYTMVQSTPSCDQRELEIIQNVITITCFPCLFFDLLLQPSWLGCLFLSWYKAPLHASNASLKNLKMLSLLHIFLFCFLTCCCCPQG